MSDNICPACGQEKGNDSCDQCGPALPFECRRCSKWLETATTPCPICENQQRKADREYADRQAARKCTEQRLADTGNYCPCCGEPPGRCHWTGTERDYWGGRGRS